MSQTFNQIASASPLQQPDVRHPSSIEPMMQRARPSTSTFAAAFKRIAVSPSHSSSSGLPSPSFIRSMPGPFTRLRPSTIRRLQ